jgi:APA family basic amino acid/polyamine antiporter
MADSSTLNRSLSLPLITFYGLGTIIGAGIYVLIGVVASKAGMYSPIAFLLAAFIAGFTAFSYAELTSRLPRSAGEAVYFQEAFGKRWLSSTIGWFVVAIGLVSAATIANGFVGYLEFFIQIPDWLAITCLVIFLGLIAAIGISQSVWLAAIITLIEIGGLIYVLVVAGDNFSHLPERLPEMIPSLDVSTWNGIFIGAFLAFYAFIGFEDMVNVAEEVKDAPRTLPKAIVLALVISTVLYLAIALVAVLALPINDLASSKAPLATIVEASNNKSTLLISAISLIAVVNGALIQIIMASRVLYGMGNTNLAPHLLAKINPRTQTPLVATGLTVLAVLVLALWLPLVTLAQITSFITLLIFAGVNLALIKLKLRTPIIQGVVHYPLWVPIMGAMLSIIFLVIQSGIRT